MATGDVIGRAFIEILPDLDRFISQLRRDLKAALSGAESDFKSATAGMSRSFQNVGRTVSDVGDDITGEAARTASVTKKEVDRLTASAIKAAAKQRGAIVKEAIRGRERAIAEAQKTRAAVTKEVNKLTAAAVKAAAKQRGAVIKEAVKARQAAVKEAIKQRDAEIKARNRAADAIGRIMARAAKQARRDSQRLKSVFVNVLDLFVTGPEIRLFISKLGSNIIFALGGLAAALGQAVGELALPIIATFAQSLAFLPGVVLGLAGTFGVLKAATANVGDALDAVAKNNVDALEKALERLSPAARAFVLEVKALKEELRPLQQAMQDAFFSGIDTNIGLIGRNIQMLSVPLTAVSNALNGIIRDVTRFGGSLQALAAARSILGGIRDFFVALRPAVTPLLEALAGLATQAGKFGGALGKALSDLLIRFSQFISQINLTEVFNNMKAALTALSPAFRLFQTLLGSVDEIATAFRPALAALSPALQNFAQILVGIAQGLGPGLATLIRAIGDALGALIPVAEPVGQAMGAIATAAAPLLRAFGVALANALATLAPLITGILTALQPLIAVFAEAAIQVGVQLLPVLLKLAVTALPPIAKAAQEVFNAFIPLVPIIARMATTFLTQLTPGLLEATKAFLTGLLPQIVQFAKVLGPVLLQFLLALEPHIPLLVEGILAMVKSWVQLQVAFAPLIPLIAQVIAGLIQLFGGAIVNSIAAFRGFINAIRSVANTINSFRNGAIRLLRDALRGAGIAFAVLSSAARTQIDRLSSFIRSIPGRARSAIGNAGRILFRAGRNIIQGLIDGIRNMIPNLISAISNAVQTIRNHLPFSPAKIGPLSGKGDPMIAGSKIAQMLADGIHSQINDIQRAADAAVMAVATRIRPSNLATTGNIVSPLLQPASPSPAQDTLSPLAETVLPQAIARELARLLNGMEWRFVDVDRVVSRANGRQTRIHSRM